MFERSVIEDVSDWDGDHMHELREGEDDEHAEAEEDMDFMHHGGIGEEGPRIAFKDDETLCPAVEIHVVVEVMAYRLRRTKQACDDLKDDEGKEEPVTEPAVGFHRWVRGAPQGHHQHTRECDETGRTTHEDSQLALLLVRDEPVVGPLRCQEAEDMAEEHHDDADMEEVAAVF